MIEGSVWSRWRRTLVGGQRMAPSVVISEIDSWAYCLFKKLWISLQSSYGKWPWRREVFLSLCLHGLSARQLPWVPDLCYCFFYGHCYFLAMHLSFLRGGNELKNTLEAKAHCSVQSFKEWSNFQSVSLFGKDYVLSSHCRESFMLWERTYRVIMYLTYHFNKDSSYFAPIDDFRWRTHHNFVYVFALLRACCFLFHGTPWFSWKMILGEASGGIQSILAPGCSVVYRGLASDRISLDNCSGAASLVSPCLNWVGTIVFSQGVDGKRTSSFHR